MGAVFFFLKSYNRFLAHQKSIDTQKVRLQILKDQQKEIDGKRRIVRLANDFIRNAESVGLEDQRWANHEVNIEQPVYFTELEQLINQCTNTTSYYFQPQSLHLKTVALPDSENPDDAPASGVAPSIELADRDILITLKGTFMVGPR